MIGPSLSEVREAFVDAYSQAARAGADMRSAANLIEGIRDLIADETNPYVIWAKLNVSVGVADPERLMPVIIKLSRNWERIFTEHEITRVREAFAQNPEQGWRTWLQAYADSHGDVWHERFAMSLATDALEWSPETDWPLERIRNVVDMVLRGRWSETYDWLIFLARQEMLQERRVTFLCAAAEIQMWYFEQFTKAELHIRETERIAMEDPVIDQIWGELSLQRGELDKAKEYFEKSIQQKPNDADGFCRLGDVIDQTGDVTGAGSLYQQAVSNAPGMTEGYRSLLKFHGKPVWFADRRPLLAPLAERMKALSEREEDVCVELGAIYDLNGLFDEARECYQHAIDIDERSLSAVTYLAYSYLNEAANIPDAATALRDKARTAFAKAIEVAPNSLDGYWGMADVAIAEENWGSVLEWCDQGLKCHPEWESKVLTRRADALGKIGRMEEAERDLNRSLALEQENPQAVAGFRNLAGVCRSNARTDDALRLLEKWHNLSGANADIDYHNTLGNWSYEARDYVTAASRYRLAIAAAPDDPVLHSNLALALESSNTEGHRLEELTEAAAQLRRALELSPQSADFRQRLDKYDADRALLEAYGEKAAVFEPVVTPVRVDMADPSKLLNEAQDQLSAATQSTMEGFRVRFRDVWGVAIPQILFGILDNSAPGAFRSTLFGKESYEGTIEAGTDPLTSVLEELRPILETHLGELVSHDAAAEILKGAGTPAAEQILKDSRQVTRFVLLLRALLAHRLPVKSIDTICNEVGRPDALEQLTRALGGPA